MNNFYSLNNSEEKNIIKRNKIIRPQNQLLINSKDEDNFASQKTKKYTVNVTLKRLQYFALILATQENTLSKTSKKKCINQKIHY